MTYIILLEHPTYRVCDKLLDKVLLTPTGTRLAEKSKCTEQDLRNLYILEWGNQPWELKLAFVHAIVVNPSMGPSNK